MKKIMVVVMVLMMVVGMMNANAELGFRTYSKEKSLLGVKHDGTEVWDERYYVIATSEHGSGEESQILEVTEEEYNAVLQAEKKSEKKLADTAKPWYAKAAAFCTFWNPND